MQIVDCKQDVPQNDLQERLSELLSAKRVAKYEEGHQHRFVNEALKGRRRHGIGGLRRRSLLARKSECKIVEECADERPSGVFCPRETVEVSESGELAPDWEGVSGADLDAHVAMFSIDTLSVTNGEAAA